MRIIRTIRVPLHYGTDKIKLKKLDKITARFSSCVSIFIDIINITNITTRSGLSQFEKDVQRSTRLSAGFIQQCKDKALWMWKSYLGLHKSWERKVSRCKNERYLKKLKKREPSIPTINGKVPVRLDSRTVNLITNIEFSSKLIKLLKKDLVLSNFWLNLSTLIKNERLMIPLKLSNYHLNRLKNCKRIIDCEIIKKRRKYYVNITCEYIVKDVGIKYFRTVDLGILRSRSTVLFDSDGNLVQNCFKVFNDNLLHAKLNIIDDKIKLLQQKKNWKFLKKLRAYRHNLIEDYVRKNSKQFAKYCINSKVFVGYPKHIKYRHFKGNGNRKHRRRLNRWNYGRQIAYIQQACEVFGVEVKAVNESNSSKRCSNCGSFNTERPYRNNFSLFHCNDCHKTYNADFNSNINIGYKSITPQCSVLDGRDLNQQVIKMTVPLYADDFTQK